MVGRVDVRNRPAAGDDRHPVVQQPLPDREHARRAGSADELVRRHEHRVHRAVDVLGAVPVHLDRDVRCRRREVPERQGAVPVQQIGDRVGVGDDAGDVRRGGEGADLERAFLVRPQCSVQRSQVDVAVGVLGDRHDVADRLAPAELVGVVLERPDEHDRSLVGGDVLGQVVAVVEVGGNPQVEQPDQLVDRGRGAGAAEDHGHVRAGAQPGLDQLTRVLAQPGGLQSGAAGLGVGVGVARQHLVPDEVLEEGQRPTAGGVVGVGYPAGAVRAVHDLVVADHGLTDTPQQTGLVHLTTVDPPGPESHDRRDGERRARSRRETGSGRSRVAERRISGVVQKSILCCTRRLPRALSSRRAITGP